MEEFPLVTQAREVARSLGFPLTRQEAGPDLPSACLPAAGAFLAVLAAGCHGGRIGELGTGAGFGSAWLASAMPADCELVTVEIDPGRAAAARDLLAADSRVEVLTGDALTVISARGPYHLLFADSGVRTEADFAGLVSELVPGGRIVMDDVTPLASGPPALGPADDIKRRFFTHPSLISTEVVLPDLANSLLVGTKRG